MTLLFFLRSPAGNTDTGKSDGGDVGKHWNYDDVKPKRKTKKQREALEVERLAKEEVVDALAAQALLAAERKKRRKKQEEALLLLFMHEFDGYDG